MRTRPAERMDGTIPTHRTAGLGMRRRLSRILKGCVFSRAELDGFAGQMTRLRGACDALQQTGLVAGPSNARVDAMQTGDRLSYYSTTPSASSPSLRISTTCSGRHRPILPRSTQPLPSGSTMLPGVLAAPLRPRRHRVGEAKQARRAPLRRAADGGGGEVGASR